jgi:hypothetical protein
MDDETPQATSRRTLLAGMALMATAPLLPARAKAGGDMTRHVVLLGDSIFDNKRYVGDGPDVIEQLKSDLPSGWTASSNAIDGSTALDIASQLERLPPGATNLVVSIGGNDALRHKEFLDETASSVAEVLYKLGGFGDEFQQNYQTMLDGLVATKLPVAVCTIDEARFEAPDAHRIAATALSVFNDVITREAFARGIPLIDLRLIITENDDYANDIEPSVKGGAKIARAISTFVTPDDVTQKRSVVFAG